MDADERDGLSPEGQAKVHAIMSVVGDYGTEKYEDGAAHRSHPDTIVALGRVESEVTALVRELEEAKVEVGHWRDKALDLNRLREAARNAERYMTERGVSHEYPVLFELRRALAPTPDGKDG